MPYLPPTLPAIEPTLDDAEFWRNCAEERLVFQRCSECQRFRHPPSPVCPSCHSMKVEWVEPVGPGRIFTYTLAHYPSHPDVRASLPYNIVVAEFPQCGGVRLISNVVDAAPQDLAIGAPVAVVWEDGPAGMRLPRFRLVSS